MVLEQIKHRASEYLKSKGLTEADIGKVIGIFFFAKYITFISMIPLCYRFHPLRRFLKPDQVVQAREYFAMRRNRFQQSRAGQHIHTQAKSYRDWMKRYNKRTENFNVAAVKKRLSLFMHARREQFEDRRRKDGRLVCTISPNEWLTKQLLISDGRISRKDSKSPRNSSHMPSVRAW
jgi:hypothetical protein